MQIGKNSGIEITPKEQIQIRAGVFRAAFPMYEIASVASYERNQVCRVNPRPGLIPELRKTVNALIDATMSFGTIISNPFDLGSACFATNMKIHFGKGRLSNPELCIVDFELIDLLQEV